MTGQPYIEYRDVQVEYPAHGVGVRGVTLQIERGEFVIFVGPTGAGKSTLLKLLYREVRSFQGQIRIDGQDIREYRDGNVHLLRRKLGIVPQDFALLPRKTVWENIGYAMRAVGRSRAEVRERVPAILEAVNIGHRASAFPHQLSGGEQQRTAIARALINNPSIVIADEPTGNLDPRHSAEVMEILLKLNKSGATIIMASHDMMAIDRVPARKVVMDLGRIVEDYSPTAKLPQLTFDLPEIVNPPEVGNPQESPDAG